MIINLAVLVQTKNSSQLRPQLQWSLKCFRSSPSHTSVTVSGMIIFPFVDNVLAATLSVNAEDWKRVNLALDPDIWHDIRVRIASERLK